MTKQLSHIHIEAGPGGWAKVFWRREAGPERVVFARFRPPARRAKRGPWLLVGLQAPANERLHTAFLDDVPRYQIELAVNASGVVQKGLRDLLDKPVQGDLDGVFPKEYREAPRVKLERPARNQFSPEFLRDVATAYRQAVAAGLPPLRTMAEDSGVPQGTIARWVAKARDEKFLPPPSKGKVIVDAS